MINADNTSGSESCPGPLGNSDIESSDDGCINRVPVNKTKQQTLNREKTPDWTNTKNDESSTKPNNKKKNKIELGLGLGAKATDGDAKKDTAKKKSKTPENRGCIDDDCELATFVTFCHEGLDVLINSIEPYEIRGVAYAIVTNCCHYF